MKSLVKMGVVLMAALTLAAYTTNAQPPASSGGTNMPSATPKPRARPFAGTIASIDTAAKTLTLTLASGSTDTFQITSKTKYRINGAPGTIDDLTVGEKIRVAARKNEAGDWVASTISNGKPKKAAPSTNAPPAGQ